MREGGLLASSVEPAGLVSEQAQELARVAAA